MEIEDDEGMSAEAQTIWRACGRSANDVGGEILCTPTHRARTGTPDLLVPGASDALAILGPAEVAILETFVVPRYLSVFGEFALDLLVESEDAQSST